MIDRLEIYHILVRDHNMSLSEILDMPPWMLDIKLIQIQRDLEERAEALKKKSNLN